MTAGVPQKRKRKRRGGGSGARAHLHAGRVREWHPLGPGARQVSPDGVDEVIQALGAKLEELQNQFATLRAELQHPASDEAAVAFSREVRSLLGDVAPDADAVRRAARLTVAEQAWEQRLGQLLESRDVVDLLEVSRQRVSALVRAHRLIALPQGERLRLPAWQFAVPDPKGRASLGQAHRVLVDEGHMSPWSAASWFLSAHPELDDRDPVMWLRENRDRNQVVEIARRDAARAAQ